MMSNKWDSGDLMQMGHGWWKCKNILTCIDHKSWYTYKKIIKPSWNETRETKIQCRASLIHRETTNIKQHTKTKRRKSREMHIPPRRMQTKGEEDLPRPWMDGWGSYSRWRWQGREGKALEVKGTKRKEESKVRREEQMGFRKVRGNSPGAKGPRQCKGGGTVGCPRGPIKTFHPPIMKQHVVAQGHPIRARMFVASAKEPWEHMGDAPRKTKSDSAKGLAHERCAGAFVPNLSDENLGFFTCRCRKQEHTHMRCNKTPGCTVLLSINNTQHAEWDRGKPKQLSTRSSVSNAGVTNV